MKLIYFSTSELKNDLIKTIKDFGKSLLLLFVVIFAVVASFFAYIGRSIEAFFSRETKAAVIITVIMMFLVMGWIGTFCNERHKLVRTQQTADSLAFVLSRFFVDECKTSHDTIDRIVFNSDTIYLTK